MGTYFPDDPKSWISPENLKIDADRLSMQGKLKLEEIMWTLENGADLGIKGEGRWPSYGPNNPSAYEFGARLADSMQSANKSRPHVGAFYRSRDAMGGVKVSPMTVCLKPDGAARIIMNLSWPHDGKLGDGTVVSVNAGMEEWEAFEDTVMTSDRAWRKCLYRAGCPAQMVKSDWTSAYK